MRFLTDGCATDDSPIHCEASAQVKNILEGSKARLDLLVTNGRTSVMEDDEEEEEEEDEEEIDVARTMGIRFVTGGGGGRRSGSFEPRAANNFCRLSMEINS